LRRHTRVARALQERFAFSDQELVKRLAGDLARVLPLDLD